MAPAALLTGHHSLPYLIQAAELLEYTLESIVDALPLRGWAALVGLVMCSFLLLRHPTLLYRRQRERTVFTKTTTIAHRGGRDHFAENTVPAFKHALKCGMTMLEFDVWLTADDQVVVFHDGDLKRMTGVDGHVVDFKYKDLPRTATPTPDEWLQGEPPPAPKAKVALGGNGKATGKAKPPPQMAAQMWSNKGAALPLLREVLANTPVDTCLLVEFKQDSQLLVEKVFAILEEQGRLDHVLWFSLQAKINKRLFDYRPELPRVTSVMEVMKLLISYRLGVLPFLPIPGEISAFGAPVRAVSLGLARAGNPIAQLLPDRVVHWIISIIRPDAKLIAHLRARGVWTVAMGVNSVEEMGEAEEMGFDAFMSDRPQLWVAH